MNNVENLQHRLNERSELLLEKELIHDEVVLLSNDLRIRAAEGHGNTLSLAINLNKVQSEINRFTRRMKALVSELSMYQAASVKLKRTKIERIDELKSAHDKVTEGFPPNKEAEREWLHFCLDRSRRQQQYLTEERCVLLRLCLETSKVLQFCHCAVCVCLLFFFFCFLFVISFEKARCLRTELFAHVSSGQLV